jgi:GNAT superfamily N-acetyltransferase
MDLSFADATPEDAAALAEMRTAVADRLTQEHGRGPWSSAVTERGVLHGLHAHSRVLVASSGAAPGNLSPGSLLGSLRLVTKKPWAIDVAYFTAVRRPLYLVDMAVTPGRQRQGIGRRLLAEASVVARAWPGDAIRLDAFDGPAGAGDFYARCGFREVGRVIYRGTPLVYFEHLL